MTAVCRLAYFTILLVTCPEKIKLSEKLRLMFWPDVELKMLLNEVSEQLITSG